MNLWNKVVFVVVFSSIIMLNACQKDRVILEGDVSLDFSVDTLRFDTVFTEAGSATRFLKIYNNNSGTVKISNIKLNQGDNSFFRINVDGVPGNSINDVEILANDSLYIFAEVTIDPNMPLSSSPFVIEEYLKFDVNGNEQQVLMEAWGQNAVYLPSRSAQGRTNVLSCDLGEIALDSDIPYVIYGYLVIDSCHIVLPAGTRIYVHGGLTRDDEGATRQEGLIGVLPAGKISANGTLQEPVIIEGDRLEPEFENKLGQWNGIVLDGSKENNFTHTIVRNAIDGFVLYSGSEIKLENTQIYNSSRNGLVAFDSKVEAENCLIHTAGANSVALLDGGEHSFEYCTIVNFGNETEALVLDNIVCVAVNDEGECVEERLNILRSKFKNCIISGDDEDEIRLSNGNKSNQDAFDFSFTNCIVTVDELTDADQYPNFFENCTRCDNVVFSEEPLFLDADKADFRLDTMSVAIMNASPISDLLFDIEGNRRDATTPDIGCYEFQD